jgi:hypothetical protein
VAEVPSADHVSEGEETEEQEDQTGLPTSDEEFIPESIDSDTNEEETGSAPFPGRYERRSRKPPRWMEDYA